MQTSSGVSSPDQKVPKDLNNRNVIKRPSARRNKLFVSDVCNRFCCRRESLSCQAVYQNQQTEGKHSYWHTHSHTHADAFRSGCCWRTFQLSIKFSVNCKTNMAAVERGEQLRYVTFVFTAADYWSVDSLIGCLIYTEEKRVVQCSTFYSVLKESLRLIIDPVKSWRLIQ